MDYLKIKNLNKNIFDEEKCHFSSKSYRIYVSKHTENQISYPPFDKICLVLNDPWINAPTPTSSHHKEVFFQEKKKTHCYLQKLHREALYSHLIAFINRFGPISAGQEQTEYIRTQ